MLPPALASLRCGHGASDRACLIWCWQEMGLSP